MDGWDRNREGVQLDSFGPSWCAEKLMKKMGDYTPVPKDIFSQVEAPGRYNPDFIAADVRPEKIAETESLQQYACRHPGERLPEMAQEGRLENCQAIHRTLAEAGLWMRVQHGHLVICDGYDHNQTPVRADSVWSLLTLDNVNQLDGGWQPVPTDIFRQVTPTERFRGRRMESCPATDKEWHRMRTGTGPQGAIKRELFSDKESLWGYSISHCSPQIEEMITQGEFTWQRCHELFAQQGLMLQKQHHGLVVVDAFNHEQTPVKASSIHPDLTLGRAEPQAGPFVSAPADLFDRVQPESAITRSWLSVTGTGSAVNVTQCCAGSDVKPELRPVLTCVPAIWHGVNNGVNQICVMGNVVGKFIRHAVCGSHTFVRSTMIRHYVSCIITLQKFSECRH